MDHAPAHRLNEFPVSYSLTGCAPALPVSASPTALEYAVPSPCRSNAFQRTANSVLTICVSGGGKRKINTLTADIRSRKAMLGARRQQLLGASRTGRDPNRDFSDPADRVQSLSDRDIAVQRLDRRFRLTHDIDLALAKLENHPTGIVRDVVSRSLRSVSMRFLGLVYVSRASPTRKPWSAS